MTPRTLLLDLEAAKTQYGGDAAARKKALLRSLAAAAFGRSGDVHRFHEVLCFLQAYPDDAELLAFVDGLLERFEQRGDLRRHREELASSGIAGTPIDYTFFWPMAAWLAERHPERLAIDWREFENAKRLEALLPLLALYSETPGLDEFGFSVREWIDRMRRREESDGTFVVRRIAGMRLDSFVGERLYEDLELPLRLHSGPGGPSRTRARLTPERVAYQAAPLDRGRPDLRAEVRRPPLAVRALGERDGRRLIDAARESMVTRARDLDAFSQGSPKDVRLVDWGDGLQFAVIGLVPERRLMLESVYGFLTLKNGVPIGYVLISALFSSSELAYNVFETFRGAEAARIYGRVVATTHHLFGSDCFTIYPYQLGDHNEEGLKSGAFWFYYKLGFRHRDRGAQRLALAEERRIRRDRAYRTPIPTLKKLAAHNVYLDLGRPREDVIGLLPLAGVGLAITRYLAARFGSDRERSLEICAREAAARLGVRSTAGWSAGEKLAWRRWSPLALLLPEVDRWTAAEKRQFAAVMRAKGGDVESEFVRLFDGHRALRGAVRRLARRESETA